MHLKTYPKKLNVLQLISSLLQLDISVCNVKYFVAVRVLKLWCFWRHFQQYLSYIVAVSFIGGGNRSTRRKPPTCHKSLTNYIIMLYQTAFENITSVVIGTDCTSSCKSNYHMITNMTAPKLNVLQLDISSQKKSIGTVLFGNYTKSIILKHY